MRGLKLLLSTITYVVCKYCVLSLLLLVPIAQAEKIPITSENLRDFKVYSNGFFGCLLSKHVATKGKFGKARAFEVGEAFKTISKKQQKQQLATFTKRISALKKLVHSNSRRRSRTQQRLTKTVEEKKLFKQNSRDCFQSYNIVQQEVPSPTPTIARGSSEITTPTHTPTLTATPTATQEPTQTPTPRASVTFTPFPTLTNTPTRTPTATSTSTFSPTQTSTPTPTPNSQAMYALVNGGLPIDTSDGQILYHSQPNGYVATTVDQSNSLYFFYDTPKLLSNMGRYNSTAKRWEVDTGTGWSNSANAVPRPIAEGLSGFHNFTPLFLDGVLHLFAQQTLKVGNSNLDVHSTSALLKFDSLGWRWWNGDNTYSKSDFKAPFYSQSSSGVAFAFDPSNRSGILMDLFGTQRNPFLVSARFRPDSLQMFERWNQDRWVPFQGSQARWDCESGQNSTCSAVPPNGYPESQSFVLSPKIVHVKGTQKFLVLFKLSNSQYLQGSVALLYDNETQLWQWWNGSTFDSGIVPDWRAFISADQAQMISVNDRNVEIFYWNQVQINQRQLKRLTYNVSTNQRIEQVVATSTDYDAKVVVDVDPQNRLWVAYNSNFRRIALKMLSGSVWTDYGVIFSDQDEVDLHSLNMVGNSLPVILLGRRTNGEARLFALSQPNNSYWAGEQPLVLETPRAPVLNLNYLEPDFAWAGENGFRTLAVGNLTRDTDNFVYIPNFAFNSVHILREEAPGQTYQPGVNYLWGGSYFQNGNPIPGWSLFHFPSGVAVHNQLQKVYVSAWLSDGGGGIRSHNGQIRIWDKNRRSLDTPAQTTPPVDQSFAPGLFWPSDLALHEQSNKLYVADALRHRILQYTLQSDGSIPLNHSLAIGNQGTGVLQFEFPQAIDVDETGALYVADSLNRRIQKIMAFNNTPALAWMSGTLGYEAGKFAQPLGISVNDRAVFVSDPRAQKISIFNRNTGQFCYEFGSFMKPDGTSVAFDNLGGVLANSSVLYISNSGYLFKLDIRDIPGC